MAGLFYEVVGWHAGLVQYRNKAYSLGKLSFILETLCKDPFFEKIEVYKR